MTLNGDAKFKEKVNCGLKNGLKLLKQLVSMFLLK